MLVILLLLPFLVLVLMLCLLLLLLPGVLLADGSSVPAALVVDCSGRYSKVAEWLALQGYQRPRESKATANCGYVGL